MTSNNQAFVKTFSRRSRTAGIQSSAASNPASANPAAPIPTPPNGAQSQPAEPVAAGVEIVTAPQITRVDPPQAAVPSPPNPVIQTRSREESQSIAQQVAEHRRMTSLQHVHSVSGAVPTEARQSVSVHATTAVHTSAPPLAPTVDQPSSDPAQAPGQPITERFDPESHGPPVPHHRIQPCLDPVAPTPEPIRRVEPFQAVWEVDVFDIPASVADLFFDGKRYQQIAERMSDAVKTGLQSVLVTSIGQGEGRSSVAIGIAMAAAASGIRVALVDADTEKPTLADALRLDLQYGWVDTIRGGLPIKEIAVHAVEDGVTLIPLMPPHGQTAATAYEVTRLVETLKSHFDLLIIDGPSAASPDALKIATAFDSAVLVRDVTRTGDSAMNEIAAQMQSAGVQGVGVVDNFV